MSETTPRTTKIWKASKKSSAGMMITENSALIVANPYNLIAVNEYGVTLVGNISIVADAHNIRRGGLFVGINDFTDMIPSTILTPLPKQIPFPPINGLTNIAKDVAFFKSLLL